MALMAIGSFAAMLMCLRAFNGPCIHIDTDHFACTERGQPGGQRTMIAADVMYDATGDWYLKSHHRFGQASELAGAICKLF
jgi:hypothetical protein